MSETKTKGKKADVTVKDPGQDIVITPFKQGRIKVALLGTTPFICNRQSEKTMRELLLPAIKLNRSAREQVLKHNPIEEYRSSPYMDNNPDSPTAILMKGGAFKSAACDSAVDTADLKAAQVRRLVSVPDFYVSMYGVPKLSIMDVRSAGINRTPDMRTRAILPEWCAIVTFTYVMPQMNETKLINLIANGGITRGVGDGRTEKGALDFGQYTVVGLTDPTIKMIMAAGSRKAQLAALEKPQCYDQNSEDLLLWFEQEVQERKASGKIKADEEEEDEA